MRYRVARSLSRLAARKADRREYDQRRDAEQLRNTLTLERETEARLARAVTWSDAWWRALRRLDSLLTERLALEGAR